MKKLTRFFLYNFNWYVLKHIKKNKEEFKLIIFHRYPEYFRNELNYLKQKQKENVTK